MRLGETRSVKLRAGFDAVRLCQLGAQARRDDRPSHASHDVLHRPEGDLWSSQGRAGLKSQNRFISIFERGSKTFRNGDEGRRYFVSQAFLRQLRGQRGARQKACVRRIIIRRAQDKSIVRVCQRSDKNAGGGAVVPIQNVNPDRRLKGLRQSLRSHANQVDHQYRNPDQEEPGLHALKRDAEIVPRNNPYFAHCCNHKNPMRRFSKRLPMPKNSKPMAVKIRLCGKMLIAPPPRASFK